MKILVLTNHGSHLGKKILNYLKSQNITVDTVVILKQPFSYYLKLFKYVKKRVGWFQAIYFAFKRLINDTRFTSAFLELDNKFEHDYKKLALKVHHCSGTNSQNTIQTIVNTKPDFIILGQTGIVRKKILDIPSLGSVNIHPGILPDYRGIDCWQWALLENQPNKIGCTIHWVNEGVDTGDMIAHQFVNLKKENLQKFSKIEDALYDYGIALLPNIIHELSQNRKIQAQSQDRKEGKQYYKTPLHLERKVKIKLRQLFSQNS